MGLGLLLAVALAGQVVAQSTIASPQQPSTPLPGVTVTAKPTPPAPSGSTYNRALNFIDSRGQVAPSGKLARWADPICPMTLGLSPEQAKFVSYRVRHVADLVGAPKIKGGRCAANVEIVFTTEPQKLLDAIAAKRSAYLGYHDVPETQKLATVTRPVQAWYLTATRGAGGATALDIEVGNMGSIAGAPGTVESLLNAGHSPGGCAGSALTDCRSSQFANILVLVDGDQVKDAKLGPPADYVALLALAQLKSLDGCGPVASILDLLTPACASRAAPDALTAGDMSYLKGLYRADGADALWYQRDQIADSMTEKPKDTPPPK